MNNFQRDPERGEIYYITKGYTEGSEQQAGRPAIVVSNDMCNQFSNTIEVVFLTTQPKTDLPTHATIRSSTKPSIALCEQINTIDKSRIGDYIATCTAEEMRSIDNALMISLGINISDAPANVEVREKVVEVIKEVPVEVVKEVVKEVPTNTGSAEELTTVKAQLDMMKCMYNELLGKIVQFKCNG